MVVAQVPGELEWGLHAREEIDLFSDASGSFGCGAWWDSDWLQYAWPTSMAGKSIALKELVPIVMACLIWGSRWRGRALVFHCDNQAVVEVVNAGVGKDPADAQLVFRQSPFCYHSQGNTHPWAA